MKNSTKLRNLLSEGPVVAATCYDALSARLAELAGFKALHLTGFGTEATQIGAPDMGLISAGELAAHATRMVDAVQTPILSDADTGFGGANNVARTIKMMERAGVAGVHIEDQAFPKRCPLLEGRVVVSRGEALGRVKAAVDARTDPDFVIVARSDSDVHSLDEVIERSNLFLEAGADMAMPSFLNVNGKDFRTLPPEEQMAIFRRLNNEINGPVMTLGGDPPNGFTTHDMVKIGFAFIMLAGPPVIAVASALSEVYAEMLSQGTARGYFERHPGPLADAVKVMKALHLDRYVEVDRQYLERARAA
ncbi:TPA: isocitrate lyase/PEP mutase family protein [Stenotrophomonas maltophilia]|uniref:isocitrate lyase/PEP mutase family protein n=1 Tax=Stenotrophomonas TaxID=40323 RepID=UPI000D15806B|nr:MULTISPECIES: isocitrate lyase/PEP mutase family protein [unclassified Stenotrophomonas]PTA72726.1 2,3-dimethylmalate lyase [Stenotrophomonas sp. Nf1]PTA82449.1 2,3-dimethylmalate lyase [Stenotrophomonas sp. Nf4]